MVRRSAIFFIFFLAGWGASVFSQQGAEPSFRWDQLTLGNHRVVLQVDKPREVVYARMLWRRPDQAPEKKRLILTDSTGRRVDDLVALKVTREYGEILFRPVSGAGRYYLYYMPFEVKGNKHYPEVEYLPPVTTVTEGWLEKNRLKDTLKLRKRLRRMTKAGVVAYEAVNDFNAFTVMEHIATRKETEHLLQQHPEIFLLFPEDREHPIRMRHDLPYRWVKRDPSATFRDTLCRNEYFAFQIGLYAARDSLEDVTLTFSGLQDATGNEVLPSSAFTCFNKEGVSWDSRPFRKKLPVPRGTVQPLWVGVDVPSSLAPGDYRGTVTVSAPGVPSQKVVLLFAVRDTLLADRGDHEPWRHSRLRWLNSRLAVDDRVVRPFVPMEIHGDTLVILGRRLVLGENGLPDQVLSFFNGSNTAIEETAHPLLAAPFRMEVVYDGGRVVSLEGGPRFITRWTPGRVQWVAYPKAGKVNALVKGTMECDGFVELKIFLTADREVPVDDIALVMPVDSAAAIYFMGLGRKGGRFPGAIDWHWDVAHKNQDGAWLGRVNGGFQFSLRGANYARPLNTNFYLSRPLHLPRSWGNDGKGGIRITPGDGVVTVRAYSGGRTLQPGDTLLYQVNLLLTPFKPLDLRAHWHNRYYHAFRPVDTIVAAGANVVNVHHATAVNPYINYPFLSQDTLRRYIEAAHAAGLRVKLYNTIRELSDHAPETFALRSLNHEIYSHGPGGGWAWLQEHLGDDYIPAWFVPRLRDAAVINSGMSRWHNYYVEGLNWLAKNMKIDGIYIDDIAFDRTTMKRVRKVLDRNRPNALIDLHSANQFNPRDGYINSANLYMEHFPYLNRLWFGEYFDKDSPADFYLLEMSGIPYGLMGEMLQDGGNPWYGMLFGMTARLPWAGDPRSMWKFWDETHIEDTRLMGFWDPACPVHADRDSILTTVYAGDGYAIVAVASWEKEDVVAHLSVDWQALGIPADRAVTEVREIPGFQKAMTIDLNAVPVRKGGGLLILIRKRTDENR